VLGPSDLYKLVKEIGKFIQNIRTLGTDLSTTFENNMESSLQLDELRKAQRELNDAFSFRRSINVDQDSEAFSVQAGSAQEAEAAAAAAAGTTTTVAAAAAASDGTTAPVDEQKKKIRRRVRRKPAVVEEEVPAAPAAPITSNVPDLEMPTDTVTSSSSSSDASSKVEAATDASGISKEEAAIIDEEFEKYMDPAPKEPTDQSDAWFGAEDNTTTTSSSVQDAAAQSRFQQQLSGEWNDQVLSAGDKLEPMAMVMNKIALLEQEKVAALKRLEEEFEKRTELEEKYYKKQRMLLEDAAAQVQSAAFGLETSEDSKAEKSKTKV